MSFFKATPFPLKFLMISFQADPQHKTPAPSGFVLSVGGTIIIHSNDPQNHILKALKAFIGLCMAL